MNLIDKIDKLIIDDETGATVTDNVADNTDAVEEKCGEDEKW